MFPLVTPSNSCVGSRRAQPGFALPTPATMRVAH